MISFEKPEGWKVLELGCGANPHPLSDVRVDVRAVPGVTHFTLDTNKEYWDEIGDSGFEMVLGIFWLEHVSWRCIPSALKNIHRILKPGGKAIFVVPNTEAQIRWIEKRVWEKKAQNDGSFVECSRIIFGDLDYPENSHRSFLSPAIATKLFSEIGFVNVTILPFGSEQTDMIIEVSKEGIIPPTPGTPSNPPQYEELPSLMQSSPSKKVGDEQKESSFHQDLVPPPPKSPLREELDPSSIYNWNYFNFYQSGGFYWNYPTNEVIFRKILERDPKNVLELGCARGYILKKLQDHGLRVQGLDVSDHAWLTRVCDPINKFDLTKETWPIGKKEFDLAYSICLLEHIPEQKLETFMFELEKASTRGVHAVTVIGGEPSQDKTRCTLRPLDYWKKILPKGHEVIDCREMGAGVIPDDYLKGDGRLKLNIGCAWTMFHHGWLNMDMIDANNFANSFKYNFRQHDVTKGLPFISTGVVDLIFHSHFLEHLSYDEGLTFLRECRRIIRPEGAMRIVVPDTQALVDCYVNEAWGEGRSIPYLKTFDEVNEGCSKYPYNAGKLWSLLGEGHHGFYDKEMLSHLLLESGWEPQETSFRQTSVPAVQQILKEGLEMSYGFSLFVDAIPI